MKPTCKQRRSVVKRYARAWAAYWDERQRREARGEHPTFPGNRPPDPPLRSLPALAAARLRRRIARGERL